MTYGLNDGNVKSATISIKNAGGITVLQWGGNPLAAEISAPEGITDNTGFSIGAGAELDLTGSSRSTLVNDLSSFTGTVLSKIYGTLNATGLSGSLFITNPNGVIVGSGGVISGPPAGGVGLLGYRLDSGAFVADNGALDIGASTPGVGEVTVQSGAKISGSQLLIAGNGAVNIGMMTPNGADILSGADFIVPNFSSVTPVVTGTLASTASTVNFTGGSSGAPLAPRTLVAGGAVTNSGFLNLTRTEGLRKYGFSPTIVGTFTNTGVAQIGTAAPGFSRSPLQASAINNSGTLIDIGGGLVAVGAAGAKSGADITNSGVINETAPGLSVQAGSSSGALGNFKDTGTINFASEASTLSVTAANIDLSGQVNQAGTALESGNTLAALALNAGYGATPPVGDVDIASNITTKDGTIVGGAIRILSGGVTAVGGALSSRVGAGTVTDPFASNAKLNYSFSLFPGTVYAGINAPTKIEGSFASAASPGTNVNLNGVDSSDFVGGENAPSVSVTANTINGRGGFVVPGGGILKLTFSGNVNNPAGAASRGATAFQDDFLPVDVEGNSNPITLQLSGPTSAGAETPAGRVPQFVNLLINGNVSLDGSGLPRAPSLPSSTQVSYANNHLVVQATGNIFLAPTAGSGAEFTFYWPGLVYLANVSSFSDPTGIGNGSIWLGGQGSSVGLSNLLPADLTTPDVSGQTGDGGIFLMTHNLEIPTTPGAPVSVTTSNDSWVNFVDAATATKFQTEHGDIFFGGYIQSPGVLNVQHLPASDFQPKK